MKDLFCDFWSQFHKKECPKNQRLGLAYSFDLLMEKEMNYYKSSSFVFHNKTFYSPPKFLLNGEQRY
jgi:hypothetical protein